jgi:amino acid transporter
MTVTLYRGLGRADIIALTLNNIVGAGIFTMPAALAAGAGSWSIGVLVATIALVAAMALCMVEVASRYDVTGGPMYYARAAFGLEAGFVVGWLMYLSRLSAFGALATILFDYGAGLWPALGHAPTRIVALTGFIAAITAVNVRGIVQGALTLNALTVVKGLPLVMLALTGLLFAPGTPTSAAPPPSFGSLGGAVLIAFFACMGFEAATVTSGELKHPRRDLPAGILIGVLGAGVLYLLILWTCLQTVPDLARSTRPLAHAGELLIGPAGATVVLLTAVISCAANLFGWMMTSPRVLYALAVQGDMPQFLAELHSSHRTPAVAIVASAVLVWLMTVSGTFVYLATFSALARLLTYASTCAALIPLRRREGPAPVPIRFGRTLVVVVMVSVLAALSASSGTAVRDVSVALVVGWMLRTATRRWVHSVRAASA